LSTLDNYRPLGSSTYTRDSNRQIPEIDKGTQLFRQVLRTIRNSHRLECAARGPSRPSTFERSAAHVAHEALLSDADGSVLDWIAKRLTEGLSAPLSLTD